MKLPNANKAIIAEDKLRSYLLNPAHRRGGTKAKLLLSMGYCAEQWQQLEADIRTNHLTADVERESNTDYGRRYETVAPLQGPAGPVITFRCIWQIDIGTDVPRLITMYPGVSK